MKTIIDIPDSFRNSLLEGSLTNDQILEVYRAARRGLILPKCHGRLIDADALLQDIKEHEESYFAEDFAHHWVDLAPTILEADGEIEE